MSNITTVQDKNMVAVESALIKNDISQLSVTERLSLYNKMCTSVGLNPLTKPFAFLKLQGREVFYATKDCTEQLRKIHGVSTQIISKGIVGDMYEVHVKARDKTGKEDDDLAYVVIEGLRGNDLANAMLKAVTKAKRRVTLSICGLGMLDESEIDTIQGVSPGFNPQIENPFKKEEPKDITPESKAEEMVLEGTPDLGEFVCNVGKKYAGKKLNEIKIFELNKFVDNTKKWFKDEGKTPNAAWVEFFEIAEAYLQSKEVQHEPEGA